MELEYCSPDKSLEIRFNVFIYSKGEVMVKLFKWETKFSFATFIRKTPEQSWVLVNKTSTIIPAYVDNPEVVMSDYAMCSLSTGICSLFRE